MFLRYSYSHLSEHLCSAERSLGDAGLNNGCPDFFVLDPHPLLWVGLQASRIEITANNTDNRLNWRVIL